MGGIKSDFCNKIVCKIWDFCITEKLWISAVHIPGISSKEANKQSRIFDDSTDWQLIPELFKEYFENSVKYDRELFICVSINN